MISMIRTQSYRLKPLKVSNGIKLHQTAGACRWVWNQLLADNKIRYDCYKLGMCEQPKTSHFALCYLITDLRNNNEWLKNVSSAIVRATIKHQADAWQAFFKGQRKHIKYHAKRGDDSFTVNYQGFKLSNTTNHKHQHIKIQKIGTCLLDRPCLYKDAKPKQAVIKQKRRYQRMMAQRKKGSNRRALARHRYAKTCLAIKHIRHNWQHHTTKQITDLYHNIYTELLNTKGMTKQVDKNEDGIRKGKANKAGLNREILNVGWVGIHQMLAYKAVAYSLVNPAYTSQQCSQCGYTDKENRKTQAEFKCMACGFKHNADINAALNILAKGNAATGRGDGGVARSLRRQIDARLRNA